MRRLIAVVFVVLVLGAWSCQAPTTSTSTGSGGSTVAGPTTTGLAGLIQGEDWHYVGEAGEPAFENGWGNSSGLMNLAFRIREAGVVDVQGDIEGGSGVVFTLPEGYRPTARAFFVTMGYTSGATASSVGSIAFYEDGTVLLQRFGAAHVAASIAGQFFLDPPSAP